MKQSIAITGSGIICAIGTDKESVYSSLIAGKSGIEQLKYLDSIHKELPVGEVKLSDTELKRVLGIDVEKVISRTALLGVYALRQAIDDAKLLPLQMDDRRVRFISGTTVGGMDVTERMYHSMLTDDDSLRYLDEHDCGENSRVIAKLAGLCSGPHEVTTVSTACSSSLNAIMTGVRMLLADEADIVIAGGTEALSLFHLNGFNSLMILDREQCRPFDRNRGGLNLGEGAAYVVLERTPDARSRNAEIAAYIAGYGNRCDAYHQTASSENGEGAYLAMSDALTMAGIEGGKVDYINAHGTGTPNNDSSESAALKRMFNGVIPPVSSTKSFTGHTTSASGAIETVISLISMKNSFIPANIGWKDSDEKCIIPSIGAENCTLDCILCNSFGFGGNDSSLILSRHETFLPRPCCSVKTEIAAEYELSGEEDLKQLGRFISPVELRRMDILTKATLYTSLKALSMAGISRPDAIIVATAEGMLNNSGKILQRMDIAGEEGISPTLFMQSTHNTLAGALAIRLKCHGYNITYTQGDESFEWAVRDARRLIAEGKAESVLVGWHNECTEQYASFAERRGKERKPRIVSKSVVVKKDI